MADTPASRFTAVNATPMGVRLVRLASIASVLQGRCSLNAEGAGCGGGYSNSTLCGDRSGGTRASRRSAVAGSLRLNHEISELQEEMRARRLVN